MRNLLAFVGTLTLSFIIAGWYFGWYSVYRAPTNEQGERGLNINVNTSKVSQDVQGWLENTRKEQDGSPGKTPSKEDSLFTRVGIEF